jgi:hypothetical protein
MRVECLRRFLPSAGPPLRGDFRARRGGQAPLAPYHSSSLFRGRLDTWGVNSYKGKYSMYTFNVYGILYNLCPLLSLSLAP